MDSVPKSSDFHYLFHLIMTFLKISFISTLTSSSSLTLSAKSFQIFIESPLYLEAFNFFNEIIRYAPLFRQEILTCLLYTSDAADEEDSVDLGGRRIIKKKKKRRK